MCFQSMLVRSKVVHKKGRLSSFHMSVVYKNSFRFIPTPALATSPSTFFFSHNRSPIVLSLLCQRIFCKEQNVNAVTFRQTISLRISRSHTMSSTLTYWLDINICVCENCLGCCDVTIEYFVCGKMAKQKEMGKCERVHRMVLCTNMRKIVCAISLSSHL